MSNISVLFPDLGPEITWKGPWVVGNKNALNDVVNDAAGNSLWYYCILPNKGVPTSDTKHWNLLPIAAETLIYYGPGAFDAVGSVTMDTVRITNVTGDTNFAAFGGDVFSTDGITQCINSIALGNLADVVDADYSFAINGGNVIGSGPSGHAQNCFAIGPAVLVSGHIQSANAIGANITNTTTQSTELGYSDNTKIRVTSAGLVALGQVSLQGQPTDTYAATMTIDVTKASHIISASHTTSATVAFTPSGHGAKGDYLEIIVEADSSGTVTATFASTFHSSGTQATTASAFSSICFRSDGTRWIELSRTTALA